MAIQFVIETLYYNFCNPEITSNLLCVYVILCMFLKWRIDSNVNSTLYHELLIYAVFQNPYSELPSHKHNPFKYILLYFVPLNKVCIDVVLVLKYM